MGVVSDGGVPEVRSETHGWALVRAMEKGSDSVRLLDLFCGAGWAAMGYHRAGFEVVGVDIKPQPRYPFAFVQADALEYASTHGHEFDVIHASPPCQAYSITKSLRKRHHPDLVASTRDALIRLGRPYVIENVIGAPLRVSLILCGSMFDGLRVYRHRAFECEPLQVFPPATCNHSFSMPASKGQYHSLDEQKFITCVGHNFQARSGKLAMGIDWMTRDEMAQAIPPAYTEYIGRQLLASVT
jgi:DNA (cytosine-5)-methyltransferase 1